MSVPRDLWVNIPGVGHQRINAANDVANFSQPGYFKGGMGKLQQIIEQDFHIPIDYYALIDYTAFKDAVNAVGGITINIKSPNPKGLYDPNVNKAHGGPVRLPNGPVHLNGMQALALALARGDSPYAYGFPLSDINRTQHQRQMLIALEQKASSVGVLSNPITITHLINAFGNNVKTNLSLADVLRLAHLAREVNINNIKSFGLTYSGNSPSALLTTDTIQGQDVLIPRAGIGHYSQIQAYYQQIIANN
jgi:LCP family protein required for cell wall assembly